LTGNSDSELVAGLRNNDVKAFDVLYWRYHQAIYANIFKLVKDHETSKDILQEVFTTLWEKRTVIDGGRSVSGWLFVVSYNRSISHLKKVLKESIVSSVPDENEHPVEDTEIHIKTTQHYILDKAIEHLSPQKRKVFELCKLQGKSYDEAAKELNISRHTVKEYLSNAVANIKDYIKQHPDLNAAVIFLTMLLQPVS
jgi:RNA polymerase sigma-70 factor (ECF subfamily)